MVVSRIELWWEEVDVFLAVMMIEERGDGCEDSLALDSL